MLESQRRKQTRKVLARLRHQGMPSMVVKPESLVGEYDTEEETDENGELNAGALLPELGDLRRRLSSRHAGKKPQKLP